MTIGYRCPLPLALAISRFDVVAYRTPLPTLIGAGSFESAVVTPPIDVETGGGATPPQVYRPRRKAGVALGKLFVIECSLVPGTASGAAFANGANFFVRNATTQGAILTIDKSIISGTAAGERNWSDEEIMILAEAA